MIRFLCFGGLKSAYCFYSYLDGLGAWSKSLTYIPVASCVPHHPSHLAWRHYHLLPCSHIRFSAKVSILVHGTHTQGRLHIISTQCCMCLTCSRSCLAPSRHLCAELLPPLPSCCLHPSHSAHDAGTRGLFLTSSGGNFGVLNCPLLYFSD